MIEAGASSGLLAALFTGGIALPHIAASGNPDLVDRFVRPTLAGETDRRAGDHRARRRLRRRGHPHHGRAATATHYVVDGAKTFITSGVRADFVTTAVRTGGPGHARRQPAGRREGHARLHRRPVAGQDGLALLRHRRARVRRRRVPVANLVGEENTGFAQIAEQFVVERLALAVHGYGIAARSLALTAAYVPERETFGSRWSTDQVVRHRLVEMHRQVDVARTYTRAVAARHVAGEDVVAEACLAKKTAVEAAAYVCDQAVQLHGGTGYLHGTEVERHYRDARILRHRRRSDRGARPTWPRELLGYAHDRSTTTRPATSRCSRSSPTSTPSTPRRWPAAARSTSSGTTPAASCWPASGSSCSSTRARRSSSCRRWPAGARTSRSARRVVTGIGVVEGVECMITANDPTVKGGASNPWTVKKIFRAAQIAEENGLPTVNLVESGGADLPTPEGDLHPRRQAVPRPHPAPAPPAARRSRWSSATPPPAAPTCPGMSDYTVMVKEQAKVFLGGPPLVKMATGEESDDESLGGAEMHARISGLADYLAEDERDAIRIGRRIVARLN